MQGDGSTMSRHTFDELAPTIDRWLHNEIVRYEFGVESAFRVTMQTDTTLLTALNVATHAKNARELVCIQ